MDAWLLPFASVGASGTGSIRGFRSDPDRIAAWRRHGVGGRAVSSSGCGGGSWSRLSSPWPVVRVAAGSWPDLRAPVATGSRGCMIPECACLRHDCSCPAAVEAAPPLVLAQMHGGLDSSRRLAIRLGSPMWRILSVVHDGRLWGP